MWSLGRPWYIPNVGIQAQKGMELSGVKPPRSTNVTQWFTTLEEIKSTAQERAWLMAYKLQSSWFWPTGIQ
jgi:hypothetical protein